MFDRGDVTFPDIEIDPELAVAHGAVVEPGAQRIARVIACGGARRVVRLIDVLAAVGFAEDAVDVIASGANDQCRRGVGGVEAEPEAQIVHRAAVGPEQVARHGAQIVEQDRALLVGVGIQGDATLLQQHLAEVIAGIESHP